jgi:hypothetical protein
MALDGTDLKPESGKRGKTPGGWIDFSLYAGVGF